MVSLCLALHNVRFMKFQRWKNVVGLEKFSRENLLIILFLGHVVARGFTSKLR